MNAEEAKSLVRVVVRSMIGESITTVARGAKNTIVAVTDEGIVVHARKEEVVSWQMIDSVIEALYDRERVTGDELRSSGVAGGYRSAFIFALLNGLPFADVQTMEGSLSHALVLIAGPAPIVLTQRRHDLTYDDEEGAWYHYPKQYWKFVNPGAPFVYYEPEERDPTGRLVGQAYFGTGVVGDIHPDGERDDHRYAELLNYAAFDHGVGFKRTDGAYVEASDRHNIVWQQAVRPLAWNDFLTIVRLGGGAAPASLPTVKSPIDVIAEFDRRYAEVSPEVTKSYVNQVRRPTQLSAALKKRAGYRCQLCGVDGFVQKSGLPYAEAHHVLEVSKLQPGSLASSNVLVLCATCHRKMHYAPTSVERTRDGWRISIDDNVVDVQT